MDGSQSLSRQLLLLWIQSVPGSHVVVTLARHHNCGHDGGDVKVGPCEHLLQHIVHCEILAPLPHPILHHYPPLVVYRLRLIPVVIGLHQKPSLLIELVVCMSTVGCSFNDHPLVGLSPSDDVVHRSRNRSFPQPLTGSLIGSFLLEDLPQKPTYRNSIVFDNTYQILRKISGVSCVNIH